MNLPGLSNASSCSHTTWYGLRFRKPLGLGPGATCHAAALVCLTSCAHALRSRVPILPCSLPQCSSSPVAAGKSIYDLLYLPSSNLQPGRYLSTGLLDGSYTHSGGSARNSLESDSSHFGAPMDGVSSFGQQPPAQRQPAFPWETVYHGQTTPKRQQPFRCPSLDGMQCLR